MPTSGTGVGTPVGGGTPGTGFAGTYKKPLTYLTLEDYARWLGLNESSIYGLARNDDPDYGCKDYLWSERNRYQMLRAIQQAESSMESHLGYPMMRRYFCNEAYPFRGCEFKLKRGKVITFGNKVEELIATNVPTGVGVVEEEYILTVSVNFTNCEEIVVYYPGQTRWEIKPAKVVIKNSIASITIPRSRLAASQVLIDYPVSGDHPNWTDSNNFLSVVDVYRRYAETSKAITFVWRRRKCGCGSEFCMHTATNPGDVVTQSGVGVIVDSKSGLIKVEPATVDTVTGLWKDADWKEHRAPDGIIVSYLAGINTDCDGLCPDDTDPELVRAIIALAHSNLPSGQCSCGPSHTYYEYDSHAPTPDEGPTIFSPFGTTRGQNLAWQIVRRNFSGWGGLLA